MMKFNVLDTQATYRRLLAAPDAAAREAIFRAELVAPFAPLTAIFGAGGDDLAVFANWGLSPEHFGPDHRDEFTARFEALVAANAWPGSEAALADAQAAFAPYASRIALDEITFALLVGDLNGPLTRGYTGFGGIPGYIMVIYSTPTPYNLARLGGTVVHELHHNIRGTLFPFNPMTVNLADYIITEGLAEAFAGEIYGHDLVGYFVTDFNDEELDLARRLIGTHLDQTGFDTVRGYIFGDAIADAHGFPKAGIPAFAGYAIGYRIVRQFQERTGLSIPEATFLPASEIIARSGYFEGIPGAPQPAQ